ncbi:hypothetical protein DVH24_012217 [Malus domestica]|uniref:Uncharacterized protein n=1 Tax=Malus domestica TaxID=3750 RepID=A0A498HUH8_MALDO|nr:hypothetical protein DVH24_012217 [Malus domestica]
MGLIVAEPAAGVPIVGRNRVGMCKYPLYPSDPTVAYGYRSYAFLVACSFHRIPVCILPLQRQISSIPCFSPKHFICYFLLITSATDLFIFYGLGLDCLPSSSHAILLLFSIVTVNANVVVIRTQGCHRISSGITVMANNFRAAGTTTTTCIEISAVALRPKLGFLAEELFYLSVRLYCGWLASCWLAMHETTFWKI